MNLFRVCRLSKIMKTWKPVASVLATDAQSASSSGTQLLGMGVSIGLISLAGAAMGALCPLCVVLQKARAFVFSAGYKVRDLGPMASW